MQRRVPALALIGILAVAGCGSAEPDTVDPAGGTGAPHPAVQTTDVSALTTDVAAPAEEATDTAEVTEEPETEAAPPAEPPPFPEIWEEAKANAETVTALEATYTATSSDGGSENMQIKGQLDDSNYELSLYTWTPGTSVAPDASGDPPGRSSSWLKVDGVMYSMKDEESWQVSDPEIDGALLSYKWVIIPEDAFTDLMRMSLAWGGMMAETASLEGGEVERSAVVEVAREPTFYYEIDSGRAQVWISADDEPRLVRLILEGEGREVTIEVPEWNEVELLETPEDAVPLP